MARFHENINWVEDNGKNVNNYNVLLNRKYYNKGGYCRAHDMPSCIRSELVEWKE